VLTDRVVSEGHALAARAWSKDDIPAIRVALQTWITDPSIDATLTTGGTGLTGRDATPEAAPALFNKGIDGFQTAWHMVSYASVGLSTLQSRACAGIAGGTFVFCLPGSNGACKDGWDKVIRWQLDSRHLPATWWN
jgi:molybdopterin adenylyltransferase